jgi:peptidoglycan/xylan/chitin deacetylase (PgdA/CDA1 family)
MLEHLRFLGTRYSIIPLRRFVEATRRSHLDLLPAKSLVITFDDGYRENRFLTDLFRRLETPATIFVCTGLVGTHRRFWFRHASAPGLMHLPDHERLRRLEAAGFDAELEAPVPDALSNDDVEAMGRATFDVQSHTVSHPILPFCSAAKAEQEIAESKGQLEQGYGFDVYALAYPNGDYSDRDCALARAAGYQCALTVDLGFNSSRSDLFRLKRIAIDDRDSSEALSLKACGLWGILKRLLRKPTYGHTEPRTTD